MDRELIEKIVIGSVIGVVAVLAQRVPVGDASLRMITLVLVCVLLCGLQIMLMRRMSTKPPPAEPPAHDAPRWRERRVLPPDPFVHEQELTWTGLIDHTSRPLVDGAAVPDNLPFTPPPQPPEPLIHPALLAAAPLRPGPSPFSLRDVDPPHEWAEPGDQRELDGGV